MRALLVVGVLQLAGCATVAPSSPTARSPAPGGAPPAGYPGDAPLLEQGTPAPFPCVCLTDPKAREWYAAPAKCQAELSSFKTTNLAVVTALVGAALALMVAGYEVGHAVK